MMRREREMQVERYQLYIIYLGTYFDKVFIYNVIAILMELKTMLISWPQAYFCSFKSIVSTLNENQKSFSFLSVSEKVW